MIEKIVAEAKAKMEKAVEAYRDHLKTLRSNRVSTAMVEDIKVPYYGNPAPLKAVSTISSPDPRSLLITPWDKEMLAPVEAAIKDSGLNVNPSNEGSAIRLAFPPLTEEARQTQVKLVREKAEEANIQLRNIRHEAWNTIKSLEADGKITEDDRYRGEELLNAAIEIARQEIERASTAKQAEMLEV